MKNLLELMSRCKNSVHVTANVHRDYFESVEECLANSSFDGSDEEKELMISTDTIIEIQCFQHTAGGSFTVYHHDIEAAIDEALSLLDKE